MKSHSGNLSNLNENERLHCGAPVISVNLDHTAGGGGGLFLIRGLLSQQRTSWLRVAGHLDQLLDQRATICNPQWHKTS